MPRKIDSDAQIGNQLKLRDLHLFFTVVQATSMAKAAAQLGISQPAVSEVIADLEHTLGVKLFDRSTRGVTPTMYGEALLKRGLAAFDELKQGIRDIEFIADPSGGELKIGCTEGTSVLLTSVFEAFLRDYQRVVMHIDIVDNRSLRLPILRDRDCDLVVGHFSRPLLTAPLIEDLNIEILFDDQLVVTAGQETSWSRRRKIELAELVNEPWILSVPSSWNYNVMSKAFEALGLSMPNIRIVTFSAQLRADMVTSAGYVATFPRSIARLLSQKFPIKILPIELPSQAWPMAVVTLKNRTLSPVVERFVERLRSFTKAERIEKG